MNQLRSRHHEKKSLSLLYEGWHSGKNYYDTAWRGEIRARMFFDLAIAHGGMNIVDLGCRDGFLNHKLSDGKNIIGIDIDAEALRRFKIRNSDSHTEVFLHDLNEPLNILDTSQDIVICGEVIEHLVAPDVMLSEINRILNPGGIFIGSTPNAFRYDKRIDLLRGKDPKSFSDPTHLQYYSLTSLRSALAKHFTEFTIFTYKGNKIITTLPEIRADGFIWICTKK